MFSLIALYFAYRADVVKAERHIANLPQDAALSAGTATADVAATLPVEEIAFARAA